MNQNTEEVSENPSVTHVENIPETSSENISHQALRQSPAHLHERLMAFCIDLAFIGLLLSGGYCAYYSFVTRKDIPLPWNISEMQQLILGGIGLSALFVYYIIWEGVWATTIGKLMTHIKVLNLQDRFPSFFSILIRNLFRFIDIAVFPIFLLLFMESSPFHCRLGDVMGRTKVIRKIPDPSERMPIAKLHLATANRRIFSFFIDLLLISLILSGFFLMIPSNIPLISSILLNSLSLIAVFYWLGFELWGKGTPGKMILGMKILDEEGYSPRFAAILMRNLIRPLDLTPLGYLSCFFSRQKQRLGDIWSMTVVVRHPVTFLRFFIFLLTLLAGIFLLYTGINNSKNFLKSKQFINLESFHIPRQWQGWLKGQFFDQLQIDQVIIEDQNHQTPSEPIFFPGNILYVTIEASGAKIKKGLAWLQMDFILNDPSGIIIWEKMNIVDKKIESFSREALRLKSSLIIPPATLPGPHTLIITVRDRQSGGVVERPISLEIKGLAAPSILPDSPATTLPSFPIKPQ